MDNTVTKRSFLFLLVVGVLVLSYHLHNQSSQRNLPRYGIPKGVPRRSDQATTASSQLSPSSPSSPKLTTSLLFVKTHKTGSTTVGNILNRYGYTRNLSFLLYKKDRFKIGQFLQHIPTRLREIFPPIGVQDGDYDNYRNYDFMTAHCRFLPSLKFFKLVMRPDTKYITILRDPVQQWESTFFFFKCNPKIKGKNGSSEIDEFFRSTTSYVKSFRGNCKYYIRNGQWYDLSADDRIHTNKTVINDTLRILESELDLVLLLEYFDESLLLLKRLMGWDFSDILYIRANERVAKSEITEKQRVKISAWNMADVALYRHFNQTLWRKLAEYGSKLESDLIRFRDMLSVHQKTCGLQSKKTKFRKVYAYSVTNSTGFCQNLDGVSNVKVVQRQSNQEDTRNIC
ncbi:galactose-3-O-sulfotransferase 2-like [Diadema setosum]|uniref:galactose-3-O-sulfotransferase 2-like n=1 Tax=Diadema setosum TaxID=31175 RepID=UPI003B3BB316